MHVLLTITVLHEAQVPGPSSFAVVALIIDESDD